MSKQFTLSDALELIGELTLELRSTPTAPVQSPTVLENENDQLWTALAYYACNCTPEADKQVEVHVRPIDHKKGCVYIDLHSRIKDVSRNAKYAAPGRRYK